jgi:flagellar basal-body rod modification protein FlgD
MTNLAIPSALSSTPANSGAGAGSSSGSASTLTQADFLQLLTAQLKFQTPTSPADPTQMASEFAEISTVDGINKLNTQVGDIESGTVAGQMAQAASLVGKQVAVSGNTLTPNASGAAQGAFDLAGPAQDVSVSIMSPSGAVADTIDLGALPAGQQSFSWAKGTAGTQYTYQVNATSSSGTPVAANTFTVFTVDGVNLSGTTPTLNVEGFANPLLVSSVQTILGASS